MKSTLVQRAMAVGVVAAPLNAVAACAKSQEPEAAGSVPPPPPAPVVTLDQARGLVKEADADGFPTVDDHRGTSPSFVDEDDAEYEGDVSSGQWQAPKPEKVMA